MKSQTGMFVARPSVPKLVASVFGSIVFVVGGCWLAGFFGPAPQLGAEWVGWLSITFFGLCAIAIAAQLFDRNVRVAVDENGICCRRWPRRLAWDEIEEVNEARINRQRFLCLTLKAPKKFLAERPMRWGAVVNKRFGCGDVAFNVVGTDRNFSELKEAVLTRWGHQNAG